jgi:hypothetical protein
MSELLIKYWEAADGIAAFACVQNVAFLLALLSPDALATIRAAPWATRGSVLMFWLIYSAGVTVCIETALNLGGISDGVERNAWNYALYGRLAAIAIFSLVTLGALFMPAPLTSGKTSVVKED